MMPNLLFLDLVILNQSKPCSKNTISCHPPPPLALTHHPSTQAARISYNHKSPHHVNTICFNIRSNHHPKSSRSTHIITHIIAPHPPPPSNPNLHQTTTTTKPRFLEMPTHMAASNGEHNPLSDRLLSWRPLHNVLPNDPPPGNERGDVNESVK